MRAPRAIVLALVLPACGGHAAPTAVAPPPPAPVPVDAGAAIAPDAPPVTDGDVTYATVGGLQVVVERMPGADFAAGQLYVRGGPRNWTARNAGIEDLAFRVAAAGGTASLDKGALARKLVSLGASISGDAHNDFSGLYLKTVRSGWDDALPLLAEAFLAPALLPGEIELARAQMLSELRREQESTEGQLWTLERAQLFAGHPYANRSIGTIESLSAVAAADVAPYVARLRETSRLVFVAVGDLDPAHVLDQVRALFGQIPRGAYVEAPLPPLAFSAPHLAAAERKGAGSCQAAFVAPRMSDPDWPAALVATSGLAWRLSEAARAGHGVLGFESASIDEGFAVPFGLVEFTAGDLDAAMRAVLAQAARLRDEAIPDAELAAIEAVLVTGYVEAHETPDGRAAALADAQLYGGDWHLARTLPDRLRAVTSADVRAFARKALTRLQVAAVGDVGRIDRGLFTSL